MKNLFAVSLLLLFCCGCMHKKVVPTSVTAVAVDPGSLEDTSFLDYPVSKKEKCHKPWAKETVVYFEPEGTIVKYYCVYQPFWNN